MQRANMETDTLQEVLASVRAKFKDVREVLADDEKCSTDNEPYKMKYQAIELLKPIEAELSRVLKDVPKKGRREVEVMLAIVHLNRGLLHADTEELKAGEEQFMKCIELLKGTELKPDAILPVLSALNQLGIVWSQWNQPMKAKEFLDEAEKLYYDFTDPSNMCRDPINMSDYFGIEKTNDELSSRKVLEKIHTLTLYYLAQVHSLKDHCRSAIYCHRTLRRQLGEDGISQDLDYIEWTLNAAALSQYFMENCHFTQARHHLAASTYVLEQYENILKRKTEKNGESENLTAEWENFKHRSADVARCWSKYGIMLMSASRDRLMKKNETEVENTQSEDNKDSSEPKTMENLKFYILEKEIAIIENQITDKYLLDFQDARLVFINVQKWIEQAKTYYTLENHASDYVLIVQDLSQAYKCLLFFEDDEDRQAKMHKRRIDILEGVIKELNPQYYKSACRQIWIELGETYSAILDIKLDRLSNTDEKPAPKLIAKINHLAKSAIDNFQTFLDSLDIRKSDSKIEQFPDEVLQSALFSYFHLGRLYNKIITPDKKVQLENTQNSFNAYKFIVDYCEKYPNGAEMMKVEAGLCKELLSILPLKITKLKKELMD